MMVFVCMIDDVSWLPTWHFTYSLDGWQWHVWSCTVLIV